MIRINRNRVDVAGQPIRPSPDWYTKAAERTALAVGALGTQTADAGVYHADQVHAALEELCSHKCAYCEACVVAGTWDVEHYRPKGRVHERPDHPGYYWLTYIWENLLLSCQFCNQRRRERPTWTDPTLGLAAGKLDHFPLVDENARAMTPTADLAVEQRLLLDPTQDDPEAHITFDLTGTAVALDGSPAGLASIRIYNLNRRRLRDHRRGKIAVTLELARTFSGPSNTPQQALDKIMLITGSDAAECAGAIRAIRRDPAAFGIT